MGWGLSAILAVALLGGAGLALATYQQGVPEWDRPVILLPRSDWGFGRVLYFLRPGPPRPTREWIKLRFFQVHLK